MFFFTLKAKKFVMLVEGKSVCFAKLIKTMQRGFFYRSEGVLLKWR
jgi:hypothetical protein